MCHRRPFFLLLLLLSFALSAASCDGEDADGDRVDTTPDTGSTNDDTAAPDTETPEPDTTTAADTTDDAAPDATIEPDTTADADTSEDAPDDTADGFPIGPEGPTWYEHVQALVYEHCVGCHQPGSIAPFALLDYADAAAMAHDMAYMAGERLMPPFLADNSGDCQTFAHAKWLTDEEIDLLNQWAETGAKEGDPANEHATVPTPDVLTDPTVTVSPPEAYTPDGTASDDYRCFIVDPEQATDTYLTAFQVNPGEPSIVHHVILYSIENQAGLAQAQARDDADPGLGYRCFGGPRINDSFFLAAWAPGVPAVRYPEDTGVRIGAGMPLIMQVHYNLANGTAPDQTTIDLQLANSVRNIALIIPVPHTEIELTPGQEQEIEVLDLENPVKFPVKIRGVMPHMHTLGRSIKLEFVKNNNTTCAINVPRWDFNWQYNYFYERPLTIDGGRIRQTCTYDTRSRTETVFWGDGTSDEMCLVMLYATFN